MEDFPAPVAPTKATSSQGSITKDTSFNTHSSFSNLEVVMDNCFSAVGCL